MRQMMYVLQFKGQAAPSSPGVMTARTTAPGCRIVTEAGEQGVRCTLEPSGGGEAAFESTVTMAGETSFMEAGSIRFGGRNIIHFSTIGEGYLAGCADPSLKHGTVSWKVDRGEGQFEGASGLITSNFTVGGAGEVVDNHFGVIFLK